jgi:hypothetical protein
MTESEILREVLIAVTALPGAMFERINTGVFRTMDGCRIVKCGNPGGPDVRGTYRGRPVAIETKTKRGQQSDAQRRSHPFLRAARHASASHAGYSPSAGAAAAWSPPASSVTPKLRTTWSRSRPASAWSAASSTRLPSPTKSRTLPHASKHARTVEFAKPSCHTSQIAPGQRSYSTRRTKPPAPICRPGP